MKIRLLTFALAFLAVVINPTSILAATLALSPSSGTFNAGCSYSVKIALDTGGADTDGTDVILDYLTNQFVMNPVVKGTLYPDYPISSIDSQNGHVNISGLASVSQAYNGSGTFATINFTIPATASPGAAKITFEFDPNDPGKTTDSNVVQRGTVQDLLNNVTDGNYTIGTGTCTNPSPSLNPIDSGGIGDFTSATPSASEFPSPTPVSNCPQAKDPTLPCSGSTDTTKLLTIVGGILTVLGVAGLALL